MEWVRFESSFLTGVVYLPGERVLYLEFRNGGIYRYFGVPPQQYEEFLASDSKGRYFGGNIRDRFPVSGFIPRWRRGVERLVWKIVFVRKAR